MESRSRMIIGCGYVGIPLAEAFHAAGDSVFPTTRSQERARQFEQQGYHPQIADVTNTDTLRSLPDADTVVFAVGYDADSGASREDVYAEGLKNVLDHLPESTRRLVFVSTTGVYGDADGQTVDEDTPCDPARPGGKAFLKAEQYLRDHSVWSSRSVILRMAGIYGPKRIPRSADIQAGRPIPAPGGGALNLIHVDDAVQAIRLAADAESFSPLYIVSDGTPVDRRDYYKEVARLLGAPEPTFEEPDPDSPAAKRAGSDRKMSNQRLVTELGFQPKHPSYREGLAAILGS
ncbi:SDR family oxidoreductase [Bremerella sp. P1]|uniref:SDR family oxidoreductase n=1 Tax=Bremerella sp. P1 TaxID=3026424 RepID=UPI00236850C1|nr:SDR family oxidoreductase [Bremerella sp. P1]WDI43329.1 SDR family oxidoreductase [Bremerella sp. P1]